MTREPSKIVLHFSDGSQKEYTGAVAQVAAPFLVNADKLLTAWEYPIQLVLTLSYDPASKNLRCSAKAES